MSRRCYGPLVVELDGHKFHVHPDRSVYWIKRSGHRKVKDNSIRAAVLQEFFFLYTEQGQQARAAQLDQLQEAS
jgi:hypothetical protein